MNATTPTPEPSWGTNIGWIDLHTPTADESSDRARNQQLAVETLNRYGWAYDERNHDVLADCFTDDTFFEASVGGTIDIGPFDGKDAFLGWLTAFWDSQTDQRRHLVLNPTVDDLTEDTATVSSLMLLTATENNSFRAVTAGFYVTKMRKEAGVWRIAHFSAGFDAPF